MNPVVSSIGRRVVVDSSGERFEVGHVKRTLRPLAYLLAVLLLIQLAGIATRADIHPAERTDSAILVCSNDDTSSDRDILPVFAIAGPSSLALIKTVSSSFHPYPYYRACYSGDFGVTWGGKGMGAGSYIFANVTAAGGYPSTLMSVAHDRYNPVTGSASLSVDYYNLASGNESWLKNATNPSIAFSLSNPPFLAVAFQNHPSGDAVFFMKGFNYAGGYYSNWTMPFEVAGAGEPPTVQSQMPSIAIDASERVHLAYLRSAAGGAREVYYLRNNAGGQDDAWTPEPGRMLSSGNADNHDIVIAASRTGETVVVVWTATQITGDEDLMYAYSLDGGDSWRVARTLSATAYHEGYPAIAVDPVTSTFHVAYWRDDSAPNRHNNILYTQTSWGDPANWTTPQSVVDPGMAGLGAVVSDTYRRPAIASFWRGGTNNTVSVAWTDLRNSGQEDIYMTDVDVLECSASAFPMSGVAPLYVSFSASASGGTLPYTYLWRFGDGGSGSGMNVAHTYNQPGVYNAVLQVTDSVGNAAFDTVVIHAYPILPDLIVSDVSFSPAAPIESSSVLVNATIRNVGFATSSVTIARFYDGLPPAPQIGMHTIVPIPVNGTQNVSVTWTASQPGSHNLCVVADPDKTMAEVDETNNMKCVPLTVLSLADLTPVFIEVSPAPPFFEGTIARVNTTIANRGDSASGTFDVLLFDDWNRNVTPDAGENIGLRSSLILPGHSQENVSFDWMSSVVGNHSLCFFADPPPGKVRESNETNNVACIDVLVQARPVLGPDYIPIAPLPLPPIRAGMSLPISFSVQVLNQGNGTATEETTIAFREQSSSPFSTFTLSPLAPATMSSRFTATWTSPATPGSYAVSVDVEYFNNVTEWDETNNAYTWTIDVVEGPITSLVVGSPNHTVTTTYVRSSTLLDFSVVDQSGMGILNTTYRIDGGQWANYTSSGTFTLVGEGTHMIEWYSVDYVGNTEDFNSIVLTVDDTAPDTDMSIGDPKHLIGGNFVTSSTALTLQAVDGGIMPVGIDYTEYRVDGGGWNVYSSSFSLTGEGTHVIEYRSLDLLTNGETTNSIQLVVDDTPPTTTVSVGQPKYQDSGSYITSDTEIDLASADGGNVPVGLDVIQYRVDGGTWQQYTSSLTLTGNDGPHVIEYDSTDLLGNTESVNMITLHLDNSPPATTLSSATGPYTLDTVFTFTATDSGCGVNVTTYRIDSGSWIVYSSGFSLTEGEHNVSFFSIDMLNNTEQVKWRVVMVQGVIQPPLPDVEANYKPLIALISAGVLVVIGLWSSRRRPWKGGDDRIDMAKSFMITSTPFIIAEVITGIVSWLTGELSIPPAIGVGTIADLAILLAGLGAAILRALKTEQLEDEVVDE